MDKSDTAMKKDKRSTPKEANFKGDIRCLELTKFKGIRGNKTMNSAWVFFIVHLRCRIHLKNGV
ncbi:hypothetical protein Fmac_010005 [Flemingia macrophylla]|uniref:Uncharacterized protein n=1 Tax=Flemingia macrophylla TaxID=520843 RepID=A0ABD1N4E9_9FABA